MSIINWLEVRRGLDRRGVTWFGPNKETTWRKGREFFMPHYGEPDKNGERPHRGVSIEWGLGKHARFCGVSLTFAGQEEDYQFFAAVPRLFQVWLSLESFPRFWNPRERRWWSERTTGISYSGNDGGIGGPYIRIEVLRAENSMSFDGRRGRFCPERRHWSIDLGKLLWGKWDVETERGEPVRAVLPMPEREYPCAVTAERRVWTWQRFRKPIVRESYDIEFEIPVPIPGKGESEWDLDDDAIYSGGQYAASVDEAIEKFRVSILKRRAQYGGEGWQPEPASPAA